MPESGTLTPKDIQRIHELRKMGYPQSEIATEIGCSTATVQWHLNKPRPKTEIDPLTGEERYKKRKLEDVLDGLIEYYMDRMERMRGIEIDTTASFLKAATELREVVALRFALGAGESGGGGMLQKDEKVENLNKEDLRMTKEVPEDVQSRLADAIRKGGVGTEGEEAK